MNWAQRILNAVSPEREVERLTDAELAELLEELSTQEPLNDLQLCLHGMALTACVNRFMGSAQSNADPARTP